MAAKWRSSGLRDALSLRQNSWLSLIWKWPSTLWWLEHLILLRVFPWAQRIYGAWVSKNDLAANSFWSWRRLFGKISWSSVATRCSCQSFSTSSLYLHFQLRIQIPYSGSAGSSNSLIVKFWSGHLSISSQEAGKVLSVCSPYFRTVSISSRLEC